MSLIEQKSIKLCEILQNSFKNYFTGVANYINEFRCNYFTTIKGKTDVLFVVLTLYFQYYLLIIKDLLKWLNSVMFEKIIYSSKQRVNIV